MDAHLEPADLRESLAYWQARRRASRWWQRARRREAQAAIERCEHELVLAERARSAPLTPARALALAGVRPAALRRRAKRAALVAATVVTGGLALVAVAVVEVLRVVFGG